jgi:hypothetical protein
MTYFVSEQTVVLAFYGIASKEKGTSNEDR